MGNLDISAIKYSILKTRNYPSLSLPNYVHLSVPSVTLRGFSNSVYSSFQISPKSILYYICYHRLFELLQQSPLECLCLALYSDIRMVYPEHRSNQVSALLEFPHWLTITNGRKPILLARPAMNWLWFPSPDSVPLLFPSYVLCSSNNKLLKISCLCHTHIYLSTLPLLWIFLSIVFAWINSTQYARFRLYCFFQKPFFNFKSDLGNDSLCCHSYLYHNII